MSTRDIASPQPYEDQSELPRDVTRFELEVLTRRVNDLREAVLAVTLELEHVRHRLDTIEHQLLVRE